MMAPVESGGTPQAGGPPKATAQQREWLESRFKSHYRKEVAFTQGSESFDKWGRRLGLLVVILTTVVGTAAFTSLKDDPSTAAKIVVAILSISAAVAAGAKEFLAFMNRADEFGITANKFEELRYQVAELLLQADGGGASYAEIEAGIKKLDDEALKIKEPRLPKGYFKKADAYVETRLKEAAAGQSPVL
jgi:hypothetical protein